MRFRPSIEVEQALDDLSTTDPLRHSMLVDDLTLLEQAGPTHGDIRSMFGRWMNLIGPTGRVSYWLTPDDDDVWWIESFVVD